MKNKMRKKCDTQKIKREEFFNIIHMHMHSIGYPWYTHSIFYIENERCRIKKKHVHTKCSASIYPNQRTDMENFSCCMKYNNNNNNNKEVRHIYTSLDHFESLSRLIFFLSIHLFVVRRIFSVQSREKKPPKKKFTQYSKSRSGDQKFGFSHASEGKLHIKNYLKAHRKNEENEYEIF